VTGGATGKISFETGAELLAGNAPVRIGAVKCDKFRDTRVHGKGCSGPALVVPGIAMTVSNGKRYAGLCPGRSAPECIGVLAGPASPYMGGPGPAAPEYPAKAGVAGAGELFWRWHDAFRTDRYWT